MFGEGSFDYYDLKIEDMDLIRVSMVLHMHDRSL